MTWESTLKQRNSSKTHMSWKVSSLSSKKRENTFRQVLEVTWHYKTMMSESAINLSSPNNNKKINCLAFSSWVWVYWGIVLCFHIFPILDVWLLFCLCWAPGPNNSDRVSVSRTTVFSHSLLSWDFDYRKEMFLFVVCAGKKFNLVVMATFVWEISAKSTTFEVSVSEFLMTSRFRSFNSVSKVTVSTTSLVHEPAVLICLHRRFAT